jgi:hypothetical protein
LDGQSSVLPQLPSLRSAFRGRTWLVPAAPVADPR